MEVSVFVVLSLCCVAVIADLNLPSVDSLPTSGTSTYMEHHSNPPQYDRQFDVSQGFNNGPINIGEPPGYAIQEGYEGFLIPSMNTAQNVFMGTTLMFSALLGLILIKKLPLLALIFLKLKTFLKLKKKLIPKLAARQLVDKKRVMDLTSYIYTAIDRMNQLNNKKEEGS